jgi:hypothetical protein
MGRYPSCPALEIQIKELLCKCLFDQTARSGFEDDYYKKGDYLRPIWWKAEQFMMFAKRKNAAGLVSRLIFLPRSWTA